MIYQVREGGAVPVRVPQHRWPGVGGLPLWVFRALEANAEGGFVKAECPLYDSRTHGLTCLLGAPLYSARCFGHTVRVSPRRFGGEAQDP